MMRRCARFNANDAWWQLLEERQHISALDLAANEHIPCRVDAVDLKYRLCSIETDRPNPLHAFPPVLVTPSATTRCNYVEVEEPSTASRAVNLLEATERVPE